MKSFSFIKRRSNKVVNYDNYMRKSFRKCLENSDKIINDKLEKINERFKALFKQLNESDISYYYDDIYAINGSENYDFYIVRDLEDKNKDIAYTGVDSSKFKFGLENTITCDDYNSKKAESQDYNIDDIKLKIYINYNKIIIENINCNSGNPIHIKFYNRGIKITLVYYLNNELFDTRWTGKHFKLHKLLITYNYNKILDNLKNIIEVLDLVDKNINDVCDSVKSVVIEAISNHKNTLDKCKEKISKINKYIDKGKTT